MITVTRRTAITLLVLTTIFWGSSYAFTKAMTVHFPPLWVVTFRFGLAGLVLLALCYREIISAIRNSAAADLLQLCSLGVINFVAILCFTTSLQAIEVTNSGFILSSALLLVPLMEFLFFGKPLSRNVRIALLLLTLGIYCMSFGFGLPKPFRWGESVGFIAAVLYAIYIIMLGGLSRKFHSGVIMSFLFLITAVIAGPIAFFTYGADFTPFADRRTCLDLVYLALVGTAIPYVLMGVGQRTLDNQTSAFIYIFEPVAATMIALLFFGESIPPVTWVGAGIILAGQYIAVCRR
jgi:drug/metabolite transporter (DMT)-like permease